MVEQWIFITKKVIWLNANQFHFPLKSGSVLKIYSLMHNEHLQLPRFTFLLEFLECFSFARSRIQYPHVLNTNLSCGSSTNAIFLRNLLDKHSLFLSVCPLRGNIAFLHSQTPSFLWIVNPLKYRLCCYKIIISLISLVF